MIEYLIILMCMIFTSILTFTLLKITSLFVAYIINKYYEIQERREELKQWKRYYEWIDKLREEKNNEPKRK